MHAHHRDTVHRAPRANGERTFQSVVDLRPEDVAHEPLPRWPDYDRTPERAELVDATDELAACLVVVGCAPEFLSDDARGIEAYHALKLRIWDEVHDRRRTNPLAALVRLSAAAEPWQAPV